MKKIDITKASWANNITFAGAFLAFFSTVIHIPLLIGVGVVTLILGVFLSLKAFRCPHCGALFLGILNRTFSPFTCRKCKETIEFDYEQ